MISGDVTGVGFRYWTRVTAKEMGLSGFVRNADRGKVEAVFEGEEEKLAEMIEKSKKGPEAAWVEKVEVKWGEVTGEFEGFEVRF